MCCSRHLGHSWWMAVCPATHWSRRQPRSLWRSYLSYRTYVHLYTRASGETFFFHIRNGVTSRSLRTMNHTGGRKVPVIWRELLATVPLGVGKQTSKPRRAIQPTPIPSVRPFWNYVFRTFSDVAFSGTDTQPIVPESLTNKIFIPLNMNVTVVNIVFLVSCESTL